MNAVKEKYITDENGKKTSIVIPIKRYERLMEDIYDLAIVAERKNQNSISLDEMKKRLKSDGGL